MFHGRATVVETGPKIIAPLAVCMTCLQAVGRSGYLQACELDGYDIEDEKSGYLLYFLCLIQGNLDVNQQVLVDCWHLSGDWASSCIIRKQSSPLPNNLTASRHRLRYVSCCYFLSVPFVSLIPCAGLDCSIISSVTAPRLKSHFRPTLRLDWLGRSPVGLSGSLV
ncbi:hypothetical protein BDW60DRAFT_6985 [Aspergillus nidulans var. acristatus]